jgi:hypothetical protein
MKTKLLSFVFINFFESGLFNELQPKKIKKLPPPNLASQVVGGRELLPTFSPSFAASEADTPAAKIV